MKKFYFSALILLLITSLQLKAGGPTWNSFTNYGDVKAVYEKNNKVWVATLGGLAMHNRLTGENQFFTKEDGIPSNTVEAIKMDNADNIWIGTYDAGIAYLDGNTWKWYNTKNSPMPSDAVLALETDNKGNKWVGTHSGLVKISPNNGWTIYTSTTSGLKDDDVWSLCMDVNGTLWVGSANGLFSLKDSVWEDHTAQVKLYGVRGIAASKTGEVVASGLGGVFMYKKGTWLELDDTSSVNPVHTSLYPCFDSENTIWVSTAGGFYKYSASSWQKGESTGAVNVTAMCLATDGSFWGAGRSGLLQYENNSWKTVATLSKTIADNNIRSVASNKKGSIWVATSTAINRFSNGYWHIYSLQDNNFPLGAAQHIRTQKAGEVWFCTTKGLGYYDETMNEWQLFNMQNTTLPTNNVIDIAFENEIKWVLHDKGISLWKSTEWAHLGLPMEFDIKETPTCGLLQGNYFWMGTSLGNIYRFDKTNSTWTRYSADDETFTGGYVHDLVWDKKNNFIWAGTWSGGASYFNGSKWQRANVGESNIVTSLLADGMGNVWTGSTLPAAFLRLNDKSVLKTFDASNSPLPLKSITSLTADENGVIWIGTTQGLFNYTEEGAFLSVEKHDNTFTATEIIAYPNPANEILTIENKNAAGTTYLCILDLSGKIVWQNTVQGTQKISVNTKHFQQGLYMLKLQNGDAINVQKIAVSH